MTDRININNSSTKTYAGEVRLSETNRLAEEQWRTIYELRGWEMWTMVLTVAVAAHILIDTV
jgi:hypothetical protein